MNKLLLLGLGVFFAQRVNADGLDDLILLGAVVHHAAVDAGNSDSGLGVLGNCAEGGVLSVQVGGGTDHDEELAACAVGMQSSKKASV